MEPKQRREACLKQLQYPSTFINARYTTPKNTVINFMVDEKHDLRIFQTKRNQLDQRTADTDWQRNNKQCCLKAMDDLIICANTILQPFLAFISHRGLPQKDTTKNIYGVEVRLNPDILLLGKDGKTVIGAIRLVFSKTRAIDINEGQVIAGIIKNHIEKQYDIHLKAANCIAIDVFQKRCIQATNEFKQVDAKVKKACSEILELWPTINK